MDFENLRQQMVDQQLSNRKITDPRVIQAFRKVPRHEFVPQDKKHLAYEDGPLPIGENQTISQPYMVAIMTEALKLKDDRILEIGTGSGYQTAILAELCTEIYTMERISSLSERAKKTLDRLGYKNIRYFVGDGTVGLPEKKSFFDAIIITSAAPGGMEHLLGQLKNGGRMVLPVGTRESQTLTLFTKTAAQTTREEICGCVFVPLIGQHGWT